jgi:hypothetical protein
MPERGLTFGGTSVHHIKADPSPVRDIQGEEEGMWVKAKRKRSVGEQDDEVYAVPVLAPDSSGADDELATILSRITI